MSPESLPTALPPPDPSPAALERPRNPFWFRRRTVLWPTWRFCLCATLTAAALVLIIGKNAHSWLSVSQPVPDAKYFVVEGWVPDHVLSATVTLAENASADRVFCTGMPLEHGSYLIKYRTTADVAAQSLARLGLDPKLIAPVPAGDAKTERTRAMAMALKKTLDLEPVPSTGRKFNLVTQGTHARRSWAIFKDVFGKDWEIGIISIPSTHYNPAIWYRQSDGAKSVINETTALLLMAAGGN